MLSWDVALRAASLAWKNNSFQQQMRNQALAPCNDNCVMDMTEELRTHGPDILAGLESPSSRNLSAQAPPRCCLSTISRLSKLKTDNSSKYAAVMTAAKGRDPNHIKAALSDAFLTTTSSSRRDKDAVRLLLRAAADILEEYRDAHDLPPPSSAEASQALGDVYIRCYLLKEAMLKGVVVVATDPGPRLPKDVTAWLRWWCTRSDETTYDLTIVAQALAQLLSDVRNSRPRHMSIPLAELKAAARESAFQNGVNLASEAASAAKGHAQTVAEVLQAGWQVAAKKANEFMN
jgi:glycosyltransferase involved in cell wall biosynthesis